MMCFLKSYLNIWQNLWTQFFRDIFVDFDDDTRVTPVGIKPDLWRGHSHSHGAQQKCQHKQHCPFWWRHPCSKTTKSKAKLSVSWKQKSSRNSFFLSLRSNMSLHLLSHDTSNLGFFSNERKKSSSPFFCQFCWALRSAAFGVGARKLHLGFYIVVDVVIEHKLCMADACLLVKPRFFFFFFQSLFGRNKKCFENPEKEKKKGVLMNCIVSTFQL